MSLAVHELTGLQKAGVLMISLGAEASARIFDFLTVEERDLLGAEIVKLRHVDEPTRRRVLDEVNAAVREQALSAMIGIAKDEPKPEDDVPLKWLEDLNPYEVAALIVRERPQNIALMLAHISPQSAADVLGVLPENIRNQVAHRLATMKTVNPEAVKAADGALRKRAGKTGSGMPGGGVFSILSAVAERKTRPAPASSKPARTDFTTIEDLMQLSEADLRTALKEVDFNDLRLALRISGEDLRKLVLANVSEDASLALRVEISSPSQVRLVDVEQAQSRIVERLSALFGSTATTEAAGE